MIHFLDIMRMTSFNLFLVFILQIFIVIQGDATKWTKTKPASICSGGNQLIEFIYNRTFDDFSSVTWTFGSKYICYFGNTGFKFAASSEAQYGGRIEWQNKTLNIILKNVTASDSGEYDVQFSVMNGPSIRSRTNNNSFILQVNDPCVTAKTVDDGCSELTCSTQEPNPQYSWTGDAAGKTTSSVTVCPKEETEYKCCIDARKTQCMDFSVAPADKGDDDGLSVGAIVGIIIGVIIIVVAIIGVGIYCHGQRKSGKGKYHGPGTETR